MGRALNRAAGYKQELKKNYIVNGAMMVSQENGTTILTAHGAYPADQWLVSNLNGGAFQARQAASRTPAGSPNRLRFQVTTADAAVAAGDIAGFLQKIEGLRVADLGFGATGATKTFTIQFGVRAPAGTYCVAIRNGAGDRSYVAEYTISAGEANTDVLKSVTIPGDTTGTWATDNTSGIEVVFALMCGSTFQTSAGAWAAGNFIGTANQFNLLGTVGNIFELFDVGLYEGAVAPTFVVPDFPAEQLLCQRYYCKSFPLATVPAQAAGLTGALVAVSATTAAGSISFRQYWPVRMRTTPTVITYNTNFANADWWDANGNASRTVGVSEQSEGSVRIVMNAATTAGSQHFIHWTANARM